MNRQGNDESIMLTGSVVSAAVAEGRDWEASGGSTHGLVFVTPATGGSEAARHVARRVQSAVDRGLGLAAFTARKSKHSLFT